MLLYACYQTDQSDIGTTRLQKSTTVRLTVGDNMESYDQPHLSSAQLYFNRFKFRPVRTNVLFCIASSF